jgi:glycosyltransferase involved in cell wall biosynthesis
MKKLLFITAFPPNNKSGGQSFSLSAIQELCQEYEVDVWYFGYKDHLCDKTLYDLAKSVTNYNINMSNIFNIFYVHPIYTRRFNKNILKYLCQISSKYYILFFDFSQVGLYACYVDHPYKIIRMHDVIHQKYSRITPFLAWWVKSAERKIMNNVKKVFVLSLKDIEIIKSVYNIEVLYTNGNIKCFLPSRNNVLNGCFLFYGLWSRKENLDGLIWFIKKVIPLIESDDIRFVVIGNGISESFQKKYLKLNRVEYLGFVDDALDIIYRSKALICPLFRGAGIKVKVIDAYATGTPVIGTDIAFEGLPIIDGLTFRVKTADDFANSIRNFVTISIEKKDFFTKIFKEKYNNHHLLEQI